MINATYQLILLGNESPFYDIITEVFYKRIEELGLEKSVITFIDRKNFKTHYKSNLPTVGIYFGGDGFTDLDFVDTLIQDATIVIPVVNNLEKFSTLIPTNLHSINGFELDTEIKVDSLVNCMLEGFSLLRLSRRLFISYKRTESRGVAIQLFEKLEQAGFDVFLDTHSIRKGDNFQEELWHRLVDTDVVVLLNTPEFLKSQWTKEELAQANSMSIGILQLVWPSNTLDRSAELCIPFQLADDNFIDNSFNTSDGHFTDSTVTKIVQQVEALRARSLAARQDNIITEFIKSARMQRKIVNLQREKYITVEGSDGKEIVVIPTIGVPHAFSYNQSEDLIKLIRSREVKKIYLLYDQRNIRENWMKHLEWLDKYLPVNSIKVTELEEWFNKI